MKKFNEIEMISAGKQLHTCQFGTSIVVSSPVKVVREKTTAKEFFALFGKDITTVHNFCRIDNARLYDYHKAIEKAAGTEIEKGKLSGVVWEIQNVIKRSEKDGELILVVHYKDKDNTEFSDYKMRFTDGTPLTDEEEQFIQAHLVPKKVNKSVKQDKAGIADPDKVNVRQYKNVYALGTKTAITPMWNSL